MYRRRRKSPFVGLFVNKSPMIVCPGFYKLTLSNGCNYDCDYCYLKGTFRGRTDYVDFSNPWSGIEKEIEQAGVGVYNTGELSDSLAILSDNIINAVNYFYRQKDKYLLFVTKSDGGKFIDVAKTLPTPNRQIIVSFSINSTQAWEAYEHYTPPPANRIGGALLLKEMGYRVRIRIDPIINEFPDYWEVCEWVNQLKPERVTLGTLRQYPYGEQYGIKKFANMQRSIDGRLRYTLEKRAKIYTVFREWLDEDIPVSLCKETKTCWSQVKGKFNFKCNCVV